MTWVRIQPFLTNWPGGGEPPVFEINSDENGTAVVELAWDPQALCAPATYPDPLRYYSTGHSLSASVPRASGGGTLSVSVPVQTIQLAGGRAVWTIPAALWAGYVEESLKTLGSPPATTFSGNLYYRVRLTPPGGATATVWPPDAVLTSGTALAAPHIGVLRLSASTQSQVMPDDAAVTALGGIPGFPALWANVLRGIWRTSPETDPLRMSLAAVFAHPAFKSAAPATRTDLLRLWLFAGRSREKIPQLLSRQVVTGSNVVTPVIEKTAYKGGKKLVPQLLDLLTVAPHPDLGVVTKEQLLDDVITEILDPNGQVNQGGAGLCVPTSIQAYLIAANPAEYARLQVGWLSRTGAAELANGSTATVPPGIFQIARYSQSLTLPAGGTFTPNNTGFLFRTYSEMAFQGAVMSYGQGAAFPVSNGTEAALQNIFVTVYKGGLGSTDTKRAMDGLFGVNFTLSAIGWPPGPGLAATQVSIRDAFLAKLTAAQQPVLFTMYWGKPPTTPVPTGVAPASFFGTHAVVATRREGGKVFFKNPQYAGSNPAPSAVAGGNNTNPPRHYEDPRSSLESITEPDLAAWIYWYLAPDTAII
jgi:hypothetical protein